MRLQAKRAYGARLLGSTNLKIKAINQVHKSTDTGGWVDMWSTNYDWVNWLKKGIDSTKALGANTVKMTGLSARALTADKTRFQNTLLDRTRLYLDYTYSQGLYVYWQVNQKLIYGTTAELNTTAFETIKLLRDYPHVIGLDLWNEPDAEGAAGQSVITAYLAATVPTLRALAPHIPLTVSTAIPDTNWGTYQRIVDAAPYVDFYDLHFYEQTTTPIDFTTQAALFHASAVFKPWLIGESGTPGAPYFSWPFGETQRAAFYGRLSGASQLADCMGVVAFALTDYDGAQFGFFPETMVGPRSSITNQFANWRDIR